nr:mucin-5AC-like [Rhipicephalus microplus]
MGGEEKMGQNSAIGGGHGKTKQAGTSEDNASGDRELWLLLSPEVGRSLVEKLGDSLDTAQPGTITAANWQQREGESADGTFEGQYIEMPCLVVLPSDDDNEVENINVQFPISSITKEPLQSTSGANMGVLLLTDDKRPEDKLNAKTEDMDHQDADTTIDNASPTITATVASATSTTMGAPGTTAAVPGTSDSTTPPPDTSATAAPGTATDKTDCLETAENKTDLALPMASSNSSSDAVPSASPAGKAAESAANSSMHGQQLKCLDSKATSEHLTCLATAELRPEDKLNAKLEDMDHQDADTTIDNASPTITATVASATSTTMGAPGTTAAVPGTSNSTTPPPDTSAQAAPGTATDKTDCLETADNKTDLALPMASCDSSSDAVPSASRTDKAAESAANNSMQWLHSKYLDCEAASEYLSCSAPAELRPEDKLNAKLEDMDHQDADTTIDNASGTSTATTAPGTTTETAHQRSAAVPGTSTSTTPPPDTSAMAAPGTTTEKTDCLETAENKTDLALPMASSNSSSDAVPSASPAGKAAESAANSSMHGQQLKCLDSKATSEHLTCLATAELRPEDKLNAKLEDMNHQDADTTIDNASPTITATVASATSTTMGAPGTTTAVPGTSNSTTPPPDTSAMAAPGTAIDKTDCLETAENKTGLALPMASSDNSSDAVPSASPADKAAESASNSSMHGQQLKCLDSKATSEHLTCSATAELRPEDKLNAKLEDMNHQDADTTIDDAPGTTTETAHQPSAAVAGTSTSTTPTPDTSATAAPGAATEKTDRFETAENKTDLALPMARCGSSSDTVPSTSRADSEAASEHPTCSAPAELYITSHKTPEDSMKAELRSVDHQESDTFINNDFLHTAEHAYNVPLPMLSRDASEDVLPRVRSMRRKAAEAAINKMMNSTGSTRKKKATNTSNVDGNAHHRKKSSGNRCHECQRN